MLVNVILLCSVVFSNFIIGGKADSIEEASISLDATEAWIQRVALLGNSQIRSARDLKYGSTTANRWSMSDRVTTFDDRHSPDAAAAVTPPDEEKPSVTSTTPNTSDQRQQQQQRGYSPTRHSSTNTVVTPVNSTGVADGTGPTATESSSAVLLDGSGFNHSGTDASLRPTTTPSSIASIFFPGENVTVIEDQDHVYYRSSITTGAIDGYWADESVMFGLTEHASLSNNRRSAATIPLSFTFYFYGHEINQITIATGGFMYMSDFLHQWLTATQYIAPMMANFDTQLGNDSNVHYMDNGSAFIVWWQDVVIDELRHIGSFNFQAALFVDGRIVFSYKKVPMALKDIPSNDHPVKVGISDAYYVDKPTNSNVKRRTIYEYHRIEINMTQIVNDAVVIITPLPTCRLMKTCFECVASSARLSFNCQWCPSLRRCSDGLDRQRQKWLETGCPNDRAQSVTDCNQSYYGGGGGGGGGEGKRWDGDLLYDDSRSNLTSSPAGGLAIGPSVAGLVMIVLGVSLLLYLLGWLLYSFSHPNSPSGRWLIEHRPSQLRMRLNHVKFFVTSENGANNYIVSMQQEADGTA